MPETCWACKGKGTETHVYPDHREKHPCRFCEGAGMCDYVQLPEHCRWCSARGWVYDLSGERTQKRECSRCGGTGVSNYELSL